MDHIKLDFEQAKAKHLLFKSRLRSLLYGVEADEKSVTSEHECSLGKWIYHHALESYGGIEEMKVLEEVHAKIHQTARDLLKLYKDGSQEEARNGLNIMEEQAEQLVGILNEVENKAKQRGLSATPSDLRELNFEVLKELLKSNEVLDKHIREQVAEIARLRQRHALITNATHDAIWDWDLIQNSLWWNDGFKTLFGYKEGEIEPTIDSWYSRIHPEDTERVVKGIQDIIDQGGKQWTEEYRFRCADGHYVDIFDRGYCLHDEAGKPYRMVGSMQDVTARKHSIEVQKQKAAILEGISDGFLSFDKNWNFTYVNHEGAKTLGKSPDELLGKNLWKEYPDLATTPFGKLYMDAMLDGKHREYEDYYGPFGSWFNVRVYPSEGGLSLFFQNITERKEAEEALRENEERLRLSIASTRLGTWDYNPINGELKWDNRCKELFGLPPTAEITYEVFLQGIHPDDREKTNQAVLHSFRPESGGEYTIEYRTVGYEDRVERWILAKGKSFFNEQGAPYRFIGTVFDISERKNNELLLKENEERVRFLADAMPQKVWTANVKGDIDYLNKQWEEYSQYSLADLKDWGWEKLVHPDDWKENEKIWREAIFTGNSFELQHRFQGKDGTYRWHLSRGVAQLDKDGNVVRWVGTNTDIHDQKLAMEKLAETNAALRKTNTDLDNFIYTASHDLKAPIANLEGLIDAFRDHLAEKESRDREGETMLEMLSDSIKRFKETIEDLTEISKSQKKIEEDVEHLDVNEMITNVLQSISSLIEESDAVIIQDTSQCPFIPFSKVNFRSVLYNLLTNAIKYKAPDRKPCIHISHGCEEGYVILKIKDNGLGIKENQKEKIFEMFKRVHTHVEGTGIGLYIVKRIVENEGGKIEVISKVNEGSEFAVYFKSN